LASDYIEDVRVYLQGLNIIDGATGWSSFKDIMPDSPNKAVVFTRSGGTKPFPGVIARFPTFQVRVRGESASGGADAAKSKLEDIFEALRDIADQNLNGTNYAFLIPSGDEFALGQDDQSRPEYTRNFEAAINT
jgi:hypothetical protein